MKYSDLQRVQKIHDYALKLQKIIAERQITREKLMQDTGDQWLVTTPLYNIGEHVYKLSDEFKETHDSVPWIAIENLRHRLVHDYDGTNWSMITDVVFEELPLLIEQLERIMSRSWPAHS